MNRISEDEILEDGEEWGYSSVSSDASGYWDSESSSSSSDDDSQDDDDVFSWWDDDDDEDDDDDNESASANARKQSQAYRDLAEGINAVASAKAKLRREKRRAIRLERRQVLGAFLRKHWKGALVALCSIILVIACATVIQTQRKLTTVALASADAIGMPYEQVIKSFEKAGFTRVKSEAAEDLSIDELDREGEVSGVSISGESPFGSAATYPYDAPVVVNYHSLKTAFPPISNEEARSQDYRSIVEQFEAAGFVNVRAEGRNNLVIGLMHAKDTVDSVVVNGDEAYSTGKSCRIDAEVVVYYHSFVFGG